jgi:hypothetical protein
MPERRLRDDQTPPLRILEHWPAPEPIKDWSLTSLKEKLIKIGAKVVSHGRYVAFQMPEVPAKSFCRQSPG